MSRSMLSVSSVMTFFFSSRRRHTRFKCDWSSDVCSSDLPPRSTLFLSFPLYQHRLDNLKREMYFATVGRIKYQVLRIATHAPCHALISLDEIGRASCRERV